MILRFRSSLLMERKQITGPAADILTRCGDAPVYTADRETLASLTGFELTRGVLCAFRRPLPRSVEEVCRNQIFSGLFFLFFSFF